MTHQERAATAADQIEGLATERQAVRDYLAEQFTAVGIDAATEMLAQVVSLLKHIGNRNAAMTVNAVGNEFLSARLGCPAGKLPNLVQAATPPPS